MTNKFREKFFFSILTSIATMLVIFLLPLVFGDSHISNWYFEKVSSVLITYKIELLYLQLSILTGLCIYVYRKRKVKGLLSEQPSHHTLNYQRVLLARQIEHEQIMKQTKIAVEQYVQETMCEYIQEDEMRKLLINVEQWNDFKGSTLLPIILNGRLTTIDLRHFVWNIGKRLGWNGNKCATFIKVSFPIELKDLEIETIRRNLRQKGNCIIELDIPEPGNYSFHNRNKDILQK